MFRKIQEREHTDSMSYSWVLMRYTIVRLVYKRLWLFFPQIGIEKQGNSLFYFILSIIIHSSKLDIPSIITINSTIPYKI